MKIINLTYMLSSIITSVQSTFGLVWICSCIPPKP